MKPASHRGNDKNQGEDMTYELNPVTKRILDHAVATIHGHRPDWNRDQAEEVVLRIIREEEIQKERFLVHFCKLSTDERKGLWQGIFKSLANQLPSRKLQKKFLKDCLDNMESCLNRVVKDTCDGQEGSAIEIEKGKTEASI